MPKRLSQAGPKKRVKFQNRFGHTFEPLIAGLSDRSWAELRQMWLNVLPHVAGRPPAGISPRIRVFADALLAEWSRRRDLAIEDPDHFDWPSTDAPGGAGNLGSLGSPAEGMLSWLGYHVGATKGEPENYRRFILDTVFGSELPPVDSLAYVLSWGRANSPQRLHKLADTIAALVRNAKRNSRRNLGQACAEWEEDLRYLYDRYYVGHFRFAWPES